MVKKKKRQNWLPEDWSYHYSAFVVVRGSCAAADLNHTELVFHQRMCNFLSQTYMEVHKHILASVLRQSANKDQRSIWCFHVYVEFKGDAASDWRQDTFANTHCIFMLVSFFSFRHFCNTTLRWTLFHIPTITLPNYSKFQTGAFYRLAPCVLAQSTAYCASFPAHGAAAPADGQY